MGNKTIVIPITEEIQVAIKTWIDSAYNPTVDSSTVLDNKRNLDGLISAIMPRKPKHNGRDYQQATDRLSGLIREINGAREHGVPKSIIDAVYLDNIQNCTDAKEIPLRNDARLYMGAFKTAMMQSSRQPSPIQTQILENIEKTRLNTTPMNQDAWTNARTALTGFQLHAGAQTTQADAAEIPSHSKTHTIESSPKAIPTAEPRALAGTLSSATKVPEQATATRDHTIKKANKRSPDISKRTTNEEIEEISDSPAPAPGSPGSAGRRS